VVIPFTGRDKICNSAGLFYKCLNIYLPSHISCSSRTCGFSRRAVKVPETILFTILKERDHACKRTTRR